MNERIKELSDKCGLAWTLKTEQDVKNLVEFAESIVRECINLVENNDIVDWDRALPTAAKSIKEYFGVE